MSYIGNSPTQSAFVTDLFNGDGSTTAFTMSVSPANPASILVAVSGVLQSPDTYSVSGRTLNFSAAPPSATGNISVRYLGIPASGVTTTAYRTITEYTATAGQTTFTPPSYTVGFINVFRNGVMLGTADYTASNGTSVVLASGASLGDLVAIESFYVSSVLNAIPATANAVNNLYIADNAITTSKIAAGAVTAAKMGANGTWAPTGTILQVVSVTKIDTFSTTSSSYVDVTGLSVSITPTSATSKILITGLVNIAASQDVGFFRLVRDSTAICVGTAAGSRVAATAQMRNSTDSADADAAALNFLDSPNTISSVTYKIQTANSPGGYTTRINSSADDADQTNRGRTASTITVMEVAA